MPPFAQRPRSYPTSTWEAQAINEFCHLRCAAASARCPSMRQNCRRSETEGVHPANAPLLSAQAGQPDNSVSSLRAIRSCETPPNTIAPIRPLPIGSASFKQAATRLYHRVCAISRSAVSRITAALSLLRTQIRLKTARYCPRPRQQSIGFAGSPNGLSNRTPSNPPRECAG